MDFIINSITFVFNIIIGLIFYTVVASLCSLPFAIFIELLNSLANL